MKKFKQYLFISLGLIFLMGGAIEARERVYTPAELKSIEQAGVYPVRLEYEENGIKIEKIVKMTILFPKTVVNEVLRESIDASDVIVPLGTVERLTQSQLIEEAKAHAWDMDTGKTVEIFPSVVARKNTILPQYDVTFTTKNGTSITVLFIETDGEKKETLFTYFFTHSNELGDTFYWLLFLILFFLLFPIIIYIYLLYKMRKENKTIKELLFRII